MLDLLNDLIWSKLPAVTLIGLGALFWLLVAALVLLFKPSWRPLSAPGRLDPPAPRAARPSTAYPPAANALQHR